MVAMQCRIHRPIRKMILMYHHVAPQEAERRAEEGWLYHILPEDFERQLRELLRRGHRFVPLTELVAAIERDGAESPGIDAITFDDGWTDNFTWAYPILQRLGLPATFFVTTGHIQKGVGDPRRMSAAQLCQLTHAGMTIGGHTRSHPNLATLSKAEAATEILGCKQDLEAALEVPVTLFAFPYGAHNHETVKIVRDCGFQAAFGASGGARNTRSMRYRLYRDDLSPGLDTDAGRRMMSPNHRRIVAARRAARWHLSRFLRPVKRAVLRACKGTI